MQPEPLNRGSALLITLLLSLALWAALWGAVVVFAPD